MATAVLVLLLLLLLLLPRALLLVCFAFYFFFRASCLCCFSLPRVGNARATKDTQRHCANGRRSHSQQHTSRHSICVVFGTDNDHENASIQSRLSYVVSTVSSNFVSWAGSIKGAFKKAQLSFSFTSTPPFFIDAAYNTRVLHSEVLYS